MQALVFPRADEEIQVHLPQAAALHTLLQRARDAAARLLWRDAAGSRPGFAQLEDHRVEIVGEMLDVIDQWMPGAGQKLLDAMYPLTAGQGVAR